MHEIFEHLKTVISSNMFLEKKGLGNEVPFFICPFPPKYANEIDELRKNLINQLRHSGIIVLDINLYDLVVELMQNRGIWEKVLEIEPNISQGEMMDLLTSVADPENHLIPAIADKMVANDGFHVMFLSGVGEVFPYIRSHTVLNNLQSTAKDRPTVMFFPGEYTQSLETGASLDLFARLKDDKYYRAFNILDYKI